MAVIDTASDTVTTSFATGTNQPAVVKFSPDGSRAYVVNNGSDTLSVIDTATNTTIDTIPVGHQPVGVELSPNGNIAYVANDGSNTVSVIYVGD